MDNRKKHSSHTKENASRHARSDLQRDPEPEAQRRTAEPIARMLAIAGEGVAEPPPGTYAKQLAKAKTELARLQRKKRRLVVLGVVCLITLIGILQTSLYRRKSVALGITEAFAVAGSTYAILHVARVKREVEEVQQEIFTLEFLYDVLESGKPVREFT